MESDLMRVLDEANARQLPALIADWAHVADERRWIARALRIDLALLVERPELTIPCLYRRCAFVGGREEFGHYRERATPPVEFAPLRTMVRNWVEQWRTGPWLRALRPPPIPLDGAVVEEYRTSERGALWTDGEHIGVGDVAWERATGRRVIAKPIAKPQPIAWERARENSWGKLVLERDGDRVAIDISDDRFPRIPLTLRDDLVIVMVDDLDMEDFVVAVDTTRKQILWQAEGRYSSAHLVDDRTLLLGHESGVDTVAIESGQVLQQWRCPTPGDLVALPDGNVATRDGAVVRVWNVGEAIERAQVTLPDGDSWLRVGFSPDGTRVFTGRSLCDASGRFMARIDCNGRSGWLEGSPPLNGCQRLCNGVFAEIIPFGLRVWSSDTGRQVYTDNDRRARTRDVVAFDPTGQFIAIWHERGTLHLQKLKTAGVVFERDVPTPERSERKLGFSSDGSLLAWRDGNGVGWVIKPSEFLEPRRMEPTDSPWEPDVVEEKLTDGLLVVGDAAIPCDDATVIASPDRKQRAGLCSHYELEA